MVVVDYDPLDVVVDPEAALRRARASSSTASTNVACEFLQESPDPDLFDGCEVVVVRTHGQPAPGGRPARGPGCGRGLGRRPPDACGCRPRPRTAPAARSAGALGLDADRCRVIAPDVGGGFGAKIAPYPEEILLAVARPAPRSPGALGRDPHREHARPGPRSRPGPPRHHRRHPRRARRGLPPRRPARTPAPTRPWAASCRSFTRMMAPGTYDIPDVESNARAGRHQHHADRGVPGRRPARGHRRHRAGHRPVRRRDRHGPGRGAAPQPARRPTPSRTPRPAGATYDGGDYAGALDAVARGRRLRRAAGRAGAAARADGADRCSASACRSTSRSPAGGGAAASTARSSCSPTGAALVLHRLVAARPGPRTPPWPCSCPSSSASRSTASTSSTATPTWCPAGGGTMGSRSLQLGGAAVHVAASRAGRAGEASRGRRCSRPSRDDVVLDRTGRVPRGRHAGGVADLGRGGRRHRAALGRARLQGARADLPVRRPRRRRRGRHRDRRGRAGPHGRVRRRRRDPQPAARRGPAPRRHRPGRGPGAAGRRSATTTTATR